MQAALSVEQDMKDAAAKLSYMAGSLKLCDYADLRALGYRTIHFRRHRYFMLYKVVDNCAHVMPVKKLFAHKQAIVLLLENNIVTASQLVEGTGCSAEGSGQYYILDKGTLETKNDSKMVALKIRKCCYIL